MPYIKKYCTAISIIALDNKHNTRYSGKIMAKSSEYLRHLGTKQTNKQPKEKTNDSNKKKKHDLLQKSSTGQNKHWQYCIT